ncbi:MFS transporter [Enterococcus florum]|uniref:MFS transporter n=1 Tax=Enterococcus florum TaxID=2480627 RepID=A0A4P5P9R7_9ENTE|nr:MFS transporter [Enterococcus florum]GCF94827.1 MFS transporter [Enterococcus florum]
MKKNQRLLILILTIGVFGIMNTEMGIIGILPLIAEEFSVSVPTASLLVSAFALIVAIAGPTMPLVFSKVNRKTVMVLALGIFTVSNIVSVFAPNFTILLLARVVPAAFHPIYVSMALTVAGTSVSANESAKAVSRVFIGVSAGIVLGVPVTSFIATEVSFALSMVFFAAVNGLVLLATLFFVPSIPVTTRLSYGKQIGVLKRPQMLVSILTVILLNGAIFGFYSYLSDFLETITQLSSRSISLILLVYGLTNIVGNVIAGKVLTTHAKKTIFALPFALITTYILLFFLGNMTIAATVLINVLGILAGIAANVNQYLITEFGSEAPDFSNGLFLTAANLGTTFGPFICGVLITAFDTRFTLIGAIAFLLLCIGSIILRNSLGKTIEQAVAVKE